MEKSNQSIARKCASHLPRLENREFSLVLVAGNNFRMHHIKASHKAQLINFFTDIQQFMVDYDIQGNVTMGREGDLFLTLSTFQFTTGPYAHLDTQDFLLGMHYELGLNTIVESFTVKDKLSDPAPEHASTTIRSKLGIKFGEIRREGGQLMVLRKYIPGPMGFKERGIYYTLSARDFSSTLEVPLTELVNKDLVVMASEKPGGRSGSVGGPYIGYAVPLAQFLELLPEWKYEASVPDDSGEFWLRRKPDTTAG